MGSSNSRKSCRCSRGLPGSGLADREDGLCGGLGSRKCRRPPQTQGEVAGRPSEGHEDGPVSRMGENDAGPHATTGTAVLIEEPLALLKPGNGNQA